MLKKRCSNNDLNVLTYTHIWEFFSTYGMTAMLTLYMSKWFHLSDLDSLAVFGTYMTLLFSSPLMAALVMKNQLSHYNRVMVGGILMALGHFLIVINDLTATYFSLALMVSGYGLFTPALLNQASLCKSGHFNSDQKFIYYYVGQNIGSLLAPIACSVVGKRYGWNYSFAVAGLGMLTGLIIYHCYYRARCKPHPSSQHVRPVASFIAYLLLSVITAYYCLAHELSQLWMTGSLALAVGLVIKLLNNLSRKVRGNLYYILIMMLFMMVFLVMLFQGGTSLVLFFDRLIDRHFFGYEVPAPALLAIESFIMIALSPLFLRPNIFSKRLTMLSIIEKYILGLCMMALAFLVFTVAGFQALTTGRLPGLSYVIIGFTFFPIAELLIMPVGFSMLAQFAPQERLKFMLSIWILGQSFSRYLAYKLSTLTALAKNDHSVEQLGLHFSNAFIVYVAVLIFFSLLLYALRKPIDSLLAREETKKIQLRLSKQVVGSHDEHHTRNIY